MSEPQNVQNNPTNSPPVREPSPAEKAPAGRNQVSDEERKCARCGGQMEEGFLYNLDTVGDHPPVTTFAQVGWMAGNELNRQHPDAWIFKGGIVNTRRKIIAWRCTACAVVELAAV